MAILRGREDGLAAFAAHRAWIRNHKAMCLTDAYSADRKLMDKLEPALRYGWLAAGLSPDSMNKSINGFYGHLNAYVADCH